jgi:hypothetical protein
VFLFINFLGDRSKRALFISAILKEPLEPGQEMSERRALVGRILERGYTNDELGQLLACLLGGKMVDINLFPQSFDINRETQKALELHILFFLKLYPKSKVTFKANLYYDRKSRKPNRPYLIAYRVRFEATVDAKEKNKGKKILSLNTSS